MFSTHAHTSVFKGLLILPLNNILYLKLNTRFFSSKLKHTVYSKTHLKPIISSIFSHNQVREKIQVEQEWKERYWSHARIKRNEASVIERKK